MYEFQYISSSALLFLLVVFYFHLWDITEFSTNEIWLTCKSHQDIWKKLLLWHYEGVGYDLTHLYTDGPAKLLNSHLFSSQR